MAFGVFSLVFDDGGWLPIRYTADGADRSPPLHWTDPPDAVASFVVLCVDPDAPGGTWYHWARYDIPPHVRALDEGPPAGFPHSTGRDARNDFGKMGYGGPAPPPAHGPHRYIFRVLAVDVPALSLPSGPSARDVQAATSGHVLAEAHVTAYYGRRRRLSR